MTAVASGPAGLDDATEPATGSVPGTPSAAGSARVGGHLASLDVVRVVTVVGVMSVHAVSLTLTAASVVGGAYLALAHVTRSVFIGLSGFVLTYRAGDKPIRAINFWRRRYVLVVVPYVAWSAIYVLADGNWGSPFHLLGRFFVDLGTGGARYHLYFLLLTFQLYAVFPWILAGLRRINPWRLVGLSLAVQLLFTAGTRWWSGAPGGLGLILSHPGSWLWSYQLYVVVGVVAAIHLDAVRAWVGCHGRLIAGFAGAVAAGGLVSFFVQVEVFSVSTTQASEVFQPAVTIEGLAALTALYAVGVWSEGRFGKRTTRASRSMSDTSFGVYLAHPLVLQGILAAAGALGLRVAFGSVPTLVQLVLVLVVLVPVAYLISAGGVALARRTPLSLAVAGRPSSSPPLSRRPPAVGPGPAPERPSQPIAVLVSAVDPSSIPHPPA